jgi:hypothetical protein
MLESAAAFKEPEEAKVIKTIFESKLDSQICIAWRGGRCDACDAVLDKLVSYSTT